MSLNLIIQKTNGNILKMAWNSAPPTESCICFIK